MHWALTRDTPQSRYERSDRPHPNNRAQPDAVAFRKVKSEWLNEMEARAGCWAQAGNIAGVGRNHRFDKDNLKRDFRPIEVEFVARAVGSTHLTVIAHLIFVEVDTVHAWVASSPFSLRIWVL